MTKKLSPADLLLLPPTELDKITPRDERDAELIESLQWGFALHPNEVENTAKVNVDGNTVIDWECPQDHEDVRAAITEATVNADIPIVGRAEHLISLRRYCNAQPAQVRNGESWRSGTVTHLAILFS